VAVLALALGSPVARASNYSIYLEPGYLYDVTKVIDSTGQDSTVNRQAFQQNYRLSLDLDLFRNLVLSGSGNFIDTSNWVTTDGNFLGFDQPTVVAFGRLTYSTPVLTTGIQYDYNRQWGTLLGPSRTSETATAYVNWKPPELPLVDLRVSRAHNYDVLLRDNNDVIWSAQGAARYSIQALDLRYFFNWVENQNQIAQVTTSAIDNAGQVTYADSFLDNRISVYANAIGQARSLTISAAAAGATVLQQRFPVQGLSLVDTITDSPATDTLLPNPALIDGNVLVTAGLNIGFGPSRAGDRALREMGVDFANVNTPVNMVYLWVDKALPPAVQLGFENSFTAWASTDNLNWTPVPLPPGSVRFGAFNNRFEITIPTTTARFLKVVTAPLADGYTNEQLYASILVTEMQTFQVVPASELPPQSTQYAIQANGTLKAGILRAPNLDYDFTVNYNRQFQTGVRSYSFVNGLTLNAKLSRTWSVTSRVARNDNDAGNGHEGQWQWTASLIARPVPTLYGALSYSGQLNQFTYTLAAVPNQASTILQSVTLFGRADLYEGVAVQATATGSNGLNADQRATTSAGGNVGVTLTPNPWAALTASYAYTATWLSGGFLPENSDHTSRLNATLVLTPFPSLSGSASGTWLILGAIPAFYGTFQVNYSPLQGELQFGFAYSRTFDTASQSTTQFLSPTVRWTIRSGLYLNGTYTLADTVSPVLETHSQSVLVNLIVII
jgi:hypothetical protein